jgi:O-antigen biosynthesis protein
MIQGYCVQDGFPTPAGFTRVAASEVRVGQRAPVRVVHPDPDLTIAFTPDTRMANDWYQIELRFPEEGLVDVLALFAFAEGRVLWQRLPVLARNHFLAQFRLDGTLERMTLRVTGSGLIARPEVFRFQRVGLSGQLAAAARRGVEILRRDGFKVVYSAASYFWRLTRPGSIVISRGSASAAGEQPYDTWIRVFDEAPERDRARHAERLGSLAQRPLISVLAVLGPANAPKPDDQIYPDYEFLAVAPGANEAESFNGTLAKARGEYVLPLAPGTVLRSHALLDLALTLRRHPAAEVIYADEDRIDRDGKRRDPRFKPAWSPDLLDAYDYVGDLKLLRAATVRALGGWRDGPALHLDLMLRIASKVAPETIVHLAKVLVHDASAKEQSPRTLTRRRYAVPDPAPLVSLIIPTRDRAELLSACIRSIRAHTRYPAYEILIVDNGSVEEETKRLFTELAADPSVRILPQPGPFNFSALNNAAARGARGSILGLVNNDVEAIEDGWLDEMVSLAARPEIGCVGARLLYPDRRLQHGGVVVGLGGVAGHAHRFASDMEVGYLDRLRAVHDVSAVTAACLLVRKDVYERVGGLDESLIVTFNDVDFCLKVRAAGYLNLWTPFATLVHHESVSRGRDFAPTKARRFADEYATMQRRWGAELLNDPYYSSNLTYDREDFSVRPR